MNKQEFIEFLKKSFLLSEQQINLFLKYKDLLQQENKKYNLTRLDHEDIIYDKYFVESIYPFLKLNINLNNNFKLLDIGSGSGIPGILLKIIYENLYVVLLESNAKKCNFLNLLINELNLKNIFVINARAEEYIKLNKKYYEYFDFVTSRAVTELKNILELSVGYCKLDGLIIQPKSTKADIELKNSEFIIKETNLELIQKINYLLNDKEQNILIFKKNKITNKDKFPRKWQQIIK